MADSSDVFAGGLFPLCPATHDHGVRVLFDLATLLLLLDCRPGDRVLDLGAGSGFSSEMLARLGYDVVGVDPDRVALGHNRRRPAYDSTRVQGSVRVVQGVAERMPCRTGSFDGVLAMNVMHHVPDVALALEELARVLKPGCKAVFCEPGLDHLNAPETQRAIRERGENDRPFDVLAFLRLARERGFSAALLSATLQPPLRLLPVEEVDMYVAGQHPAPHLTPKGVVDELHRRHAYALLVRDGVRPKTSRYPGLLRGELHVDDLPTHARRGNTVTVAVGATNIGDTLWLSRPNPRGGDVTVGSKLLAPDGRLVDNTIGRSFLPQDVAPGEETQIALTFRVPADIQPGPYRVQFDLVDELICWFSDLSTDTPLTYSIEIE